MHEIKNKIKVDIKVSVLTLEATPPASLPSLPSIESVRHYSSIIRLKQKWEWGRGDGVQYPRFLPLTQIHLFCDIQAGLLSWVEKETKKIVVSFTSSR